MLLGGEGADLLDGGEGADLLLGGIGNDISIGGAGDDLIFDDAGDDWLQGGEGADVLFGGDGNDTLEGGAGNDQLHGNAGADTLDGGAGDDQLFGEAGADVFRFGPTGAFSQDWIADFRHAEGDVIDLSAFGGAATFTLGSTAGAMSLINYQGPEFDWVVGYVDADATPDFVLVVNHGGTSLAAADFIL